MKINMKNLILISIVAMIVIVTVIVCIKTFQNNKTTIITDSISTSEISTTSVSNKTSTSEESIVEDDIEPGVIMSVTNTNGNFTTQATNIISSNNTNNLIYGDGWVATQGYDPTTNNKTNTSNSNVKPIVDIPNNNPVDMPTYPKRTLDKVKIEIVKDSISNSSVKILITDNNELPYGWGEEYSIQEKINGEWVDLGYISNDIGWIEIAYILNKNNQLTQTLNFKNVYGILDSGIYRIGKLLDSSEHLSAYSNEFEIK